MIFATISSDNRLIFIFAKELIDKMERKKVFIKRIVLIAIFIIGLGLVIGGSAGLVYVNNIHKEYQPVTAKIENIRKYKRPTHHKKSNNMAYDVIISYQVGDEYFESILGVYSSSMNIGDDITIYYNPQKPTQIVSIEINNIIWSIFLIVGGGLILVDCLILPRLLTRVFRVR